MSEILEVLRGPVLGLIFVIIALAGIIVTAAFAALIAQMGLLLRMRTREPQPQPARTRSITYRMPAGTPVVRSPRRSSPPPYAMEASPHRRRHRPGLGSRRPPWSSRRGRRRCCARHRPAGSRP